MKIKSTANLLAAMLMMSAGSLALRADVISANLNNNLSGQITQTGTLNSQSDVFEDTFSVSSYTNFTSFTTSYAGGKNADGTTATAGGFQPNLTLYTGSGMYVTGQSVSSPIASADSNTGLSLDSYLNKSDLAPGSYTLVLTDWLNQQLPTATNLSDGFVTYGLTSFVDEQLNARTGDYSLNISSAAVPEPATLWLAAPVILLAIGSVRRRRNQLSVNAGSRESH